MAYTTMQRRRAVDLHEQFRTGCPIGDPQTGQVGAGSGKRSPACAVRAGALALIAAALVAVVLLTLDSVLVLISVLCSRARRLRRLVGLLVDGLEPRGEVATVGQVLSEEQMTDEGVCGGARASVPPRRAVDSVAGAHRRSWPSRVPTSPTPSVCRARPAACRCQLESAPG